MIKELWKKLANSKQITATNVIEYAILRSLKHENPIEAAKHLLHKAFTPISSTNKLANGCKPYQALFPWVNNARIYGQKQRVLGVPAEEFLTADDVNHYNAIYNQINPDKLIRNYSYFFTRQDISPEYQLVQTAHAALELGNKLQPDQVKDLYFACCGAKDLAELKEIESTLINLNLDYIAFREPDIGNEMTAIAVFPIAENKRGILRKFPLLKFKEKQ